MADWASCGPLRFPVALVSDLCIQNFFWLYSDLKPAPPEIGRAQSPINKNKHGKETMCVTIKWISVAIAPSVEISIMIYKFKIHYLATRPCNLAYYHWHNHPTEAILPNHRSSDHFSQILQMPGRSGKSCKFQLNIAHHYYHILLLTSSCGGLRSLVRIQAEFWRTILSSPRLSTVRLVQA